MNNEELKSYVREKRREKKRREKEREKREERRKEEREEDMRRRLGWARFAVVIGICGCRYLWV